MYIYIHNIYIHICIYIYINKYVYIYIYTRKQRTGESACLYLESSSEVEWAPTRYVIACQRKKKHVERCPATTNELLWVNSLCSCT